MRVLILTSSTGGGHNMRARSFIEWARLERPQRLQVKMHKALESTNELLAFGVRAYNWIQRTYPGLHNVYFNLLEVAAPCDRPAKIYGQDRFRRVLDEQKPDLVLSVHGFLNHGFFDIVRRHLPDVRCVTYCGELFGRYGFSRHWVNPRADLFIGAVEETCQRARELGMPADAAVVGGFLLHPAFYKPPQTADERRHFLGVNLALDPDRFTLLLSTGEHGANNHLALLNATRDQLPRNLHDRLQIIALCGRSDQTFQSVRDWAQANPGFLVRPLPYADSFHMSRLLQCANAVVVRPGTGSTSESIQTGCPIVFNGIGGFMPQERITLRYARRRGFSAEVEEAGDLPGIIAPWIEDRDHLGYHGKRECIAAARPKQHPLDILSHVVNASLREPRQAPLTEAAKRALPFDANGTEAAVG
jgi:processive 1,2-diacylglycerol beta-glucosyltransferase